jgi:hypothetical protein
MTRVGLVVVVAFLAASGVSSAQTERPLLGVAGKGPLVVRGTGFEPSERVSVLLALDGRQHWRRTVATGSGAFRVTFAVTPGRCARFTIRAVGSLGSRATAPVLRRARPECESPAATGND